MTQSPTAPTSTPDLLPEFPLRRGRDAAVLQASRAVVALYLSSGSSDFSVKELADHAGLSERTFYRYFPRKEDAVRPYLEAGLDHIVTLIREAPPEEALRPLLVRVHREVLDAGTPDGNALIDLLHGTERLRAVWLQALTDAELAYAEVMAERLPRGTGAEQARLISAVTVAAVRLAIQRGAAEHRPSGALFAEFAALLGDSLFEARR